MHFSFIFPFVVTIGSVVGIASAATTTAAVTTHNDVDHGSEKHSPQSQQLLRRVLADTPSLDDTHHGGSRHLQIFQNIFDPCPIIERQFPSGQVSCECDVALTSGRIDYVCQWSDPVCVGATDTLGFCGTPVYSGTLNLFQLNVENEVCIGEISAIGDLVPLDDFCVHLTINPRNDKVVSCTAQFGDTVCDRCIPCTGGGLTLDCQNVADGATTDTTCTAPLRTVTRLSKNKQVAITQPFVPNFFNV